MGRQESPPHFPDAETVGATAGVGRWAVRPVRIPCRSGGDRRPRRALLSRGFVRLRAPAGPLAPPGQWGTKDRRARKNPAAVSWNPVLSWDLGQFTGVSRPPVSSSAKWDDSSLPLVSEAAGNSNGLQLITRQTRWLDDEDSSWALSHFSLHRASFLLCSPP